MRLSCSQHTELHFHGLPAPGNFTTSYTSELEVANLKDWSLSPLRLQKSSQRKKQDKAPFMTSRALNHWVSRGTVPREATEIISKRWDSSCNPWSTSVNSLPSLVWVVQSEFHGTVMWTPAWVRRHSCTGIFPVLKCEFRGPFFSV